jgi:hypothetical protein
MSLVNADVRVHVVFIIRAYQRHPQFPFSIAQVDNVGGNTPQRFYCHSPVAVKHFPRRSG